MNFRKAFRLIVFLFCLRFTEAAVLPNWTDFAPALATNTPIVWECSTSQWPTNFWVYRIQPRSQLISLTLISNALALASLQGRGFPSSSTNSFFITDGPRENLIEMPFSFDPELANISFDVSNFTRGATIEIPNVDALTTRAWQAAAQLGLPLNQLSQKKPVDHFCSYDEKGMEMTNHLPCGRSVFLARKIDGTDFIGNGDDGFDTQGFYFLLGSRGQIRSFNLVWPDLTRISNCVTTTAQQITDCIRAHVVCVLPEPDEDTFLERVKLLGTAQRFIIKSITPYYADYGFIEWPTNNERATLVAPVAVLQCVADFGNSNLTARLYAPILTSDVRTLLRSR